MLSLSTNQQGALAPEYGNALTSALATAGFFVPFNDLGSGEVDISLARGTGSGTFTRATSATTYDSTGKLITVASGVPRSYYDPTTLAYGGYQVINY